MNDLLAIRQQLEAGHLLHPCGEAPNIVDLAYAVAALTGVADAGHSAYSEEIVAAIGPTQHLIVVLSDGFGMTLLDQMPATGLFGSHFVRPLRTVFPSASPVALTALATGVWPNAHGVTGQWTQLPEIGVVGGLLPFANRSNGRALRTYGYTVDDAFPVPPMVQRMASSSLSLFPENLADSVSSRYFAGGGKRRGYRTLNDAVDAIVDHIETAEGATYTYLYESRVDLEAHSSGVHHPKVIGAMTQLEESVQRLSNQLGSRARIILTADHGLLDTPAEARHWVKPSSTLFQHLRAAPSGDSRVMFLHVAPGHLTNAHTWVHHRFGQRFFVLTIQEAEDLQLFGPGPLEEVSKKRLGDLVVISRGVDTLEYVATGNIDRLSTVKAHHSGLTPDEVLVPLIII